MIITALQCVHLKYTNPIHRTKRRTTILTKEKIQAGMVQINAYSIGKKSRTNRRKVIPTPFSIVYFPIENLHSFNNGPRAT